MIEHKEFSQTIEISDGRWFSYGELVRMGHLFCGGVGVGKGVKIMAYCVKDYKTKKEMMEDFRAGKEIPVFQPGPFGPIVKDGTVTIEGPHYPAPHSWYASAEVKDKKIVKVK